MEWLSGDSTTNFTELGVVDLCSPQSPLFMCCPLTSPPAFAPLEAGAVLVVLGGPLPSGCTSNVAVVQDFAIADAGTPEPATPPRPFSPPTLFSSAASAPVLFSNDGAVRWNPWLNLFQSIVGSPEGLSTPVATLSPDPGLALWLGADNNVWALRFDTRNIYSTDEPSTKLLELTSSEFAPDRLAQVGSQDAGVDAGVVAFNCGVGVTMQEGAGAFLTDATFADFTVDYVVTGPLSLALLDPDSGQEFDFDVQNDCLGLEAGILPIGTGIHVERHGTTVSARLAGVATLMTCVESLADASERVAVGFRAPMGVASVTSVSVKRLGSSD
jgi:hypothetical protein